VRINAAIDGAQAKARLANGELRVVLPRIAERRGAGLLVPIDGPTGQQATGPTAAKPSGE
jgi:hypothetical protein